MTASHLVYLSLGSNIDREVNIKNCLDTLSENYGKLHISSVFESDAVGFQGDPFFNLVVGMYTTESLTGLATSLRQIEYDQGRVRQQVKFAGRTLDIDILLFDDLCGKFNGIQLPRAEITANAYELWPLAEIAGAMLLPGTCSLIADLWAEYDKLKQRLHPVSFTWQSRSLPSPSFNSVNAHHPQPVPDR